MKVLLVEDDNLLGEAVQIGLEFEGMSVDWFTAGEGVVQAVNLTPYDCLVLDIGLPGKSGLEVLKELRQQSHKIPVILLTAMGSVTDRVTGLDHGADDYLVKPFDMDELCARIRALARRQTGRSEPVIRHGDITIKPDTRRVEKSAVPIELSRHEYLILLRLMENRGRVYSQQSLAEYLYNWEEEVDSNTVQVHIHHIRKKLGKSLIKTMRSVGYVIE